MALKSRKKEHMGLCWEFREEPVVTVGAQRWSQDLLPDQGTTLLIALVSEEPAQCLWPIHLGSRAQRAQEPTKMRQARHHLK